MNLRASIILASLLLAGACAKKAGEATASPTTMDAAAEVEEAGNAYDAVGPVRDEPEAWERELASLEAELRDTGVVVKSERQQTGGDEDAAEQQQATGGQTRTTCERRCELADAICDLEGRICDLAGRHPTEARYADLCGRAERDCETASEACRACTR